MTWRLVENEILNTETGEERYTYNVEPVFGPEHVLTPDCWCYPIVEETDEFTFLITHNVMN